MRSHNITRVQGGTASQSARSRELAADWRRVRRRLWRAIGLSAVVLAAVACNELAGIDAPVDRAPRDASADAFANGEACAPSGQGNCVVDGSSDVQDPTDVFDAPRADPRDLDASGADVFGRDTDADVRVADAESLDELGGETDGPASAADANRAFDAGPDGSEMVTLGWNVDGDPAAVVDVSVEGKGIVASCVSGSGTCFADFLAGTTLTLTAAVSQAWPKVTWVGCDQTNGAVCTVTLNRTKAIAASVQRAYVLRVGIVGDGTGSVVVSALDGTRLGACSQECEILMAAGTRGLVAADAAKGSAFVRWSDGSTAFTNVFEMSADSSVVAEFAWTPAALTSLRLWLNPDRGLACGSTANVLQWDDSSATGTHFKPTDEASQPACAWIGEPVRRVVEFGGAHHLANTTAVLDSGGDEFLFSVVASSTTTPERTPGTIWSQTELRTYEPKEMSLLVDRAGLGQGGYPAVSAFLAGCPNVSSEALLDASGTPYGNGSLHVFTVRRINRSDGRSASVLFRVDGTELGHTEPWPLCCGVGAMAFGAHVTPSCTSGTCVASFDRYLRGRVGEVVYAVGLTTPDDVRKLERYLAARFGLPVPP